MPCNPLFQLGVGHVQVQEDAQCGQAEEADLTGTILHWEEAWVIAGLEYIEKWEMEEMVNRINSMHSSQTQAMHPMSSHHTMIKQDDTRRTMIMIQ